MHVFATEDWPFLHAVFSERATVLERKVRDAGLGGDFDRLVDRIAQRLAKGESLTYAHVQAIAPKALVEVNERIDDWVLAYSVFMRLVRAGVVCHGPEVGSKSSFVHRSSWVPDLDWSPPSEASATTDLARRYLAAYGPADAADLGFWYGTSATKAKAWIADAREDLAEVEVSGRSLYCRAEDVDTLLENPPTPSRWPVRLLYRFDPLLLATKDKAWLIDAAHYKKVWRAAAHVEAVVLVGGRICGTWRYDRKRKGLVVRVTPFALMSKTLARKVERRAAEVAAFLSLELAELIVD